MPKNHNVSTPKPSITEGYNLLNLRRLMVLNFLEHVLGIQKIATNRSICIMVDQTIQRFAKKRDQLNKVIKRSDVTINILREEGFLSQELIKLIQVKNNSHSPNQNKVKEITNGKIVILKLEDLRFIAVNRNRLELTIVLSVFRMLQQKSQAERKLENSGLHSQALAYLQPRGNGHKPLLQSQKP